MLNPKDYFTFDDKGVANYTGANNTSVIMQVWLDENGDLNIDNETDCNGIQIPKWVIEKLYGITK